MLYKERRHEQFFKFRETHMRHLYWTLCPWTLSVIAESSMQWLSFRTSSLATVIQHLLTSLNFYQTKQSQQPCIRSRLKIGNKRFRVTGADIYNRYLL